MLDFEDIPASMADVDETTEVLHLEEKVPQLGEKTTDEVIETVSYLFLQQ